MQSHIVIVNLECRLLVSVLLLNAPFVSGNSQRFPLPDATRGIGCGGKTKGSLCRNVTQNRDPSSQ